MVSEKRAFVWGDPANDFYVYGYGDFPSIRSGDHEFPYMLECLSCLAPLIRERCRDPRKYTANPELDYDIAAAIDATPFSKENVAASSDATTRLAHSCCQRSIAEVWRPLYAGRAPKAAGLVLYPESEAALRAALRVARGEGLRVVPLGGGTNVTGAVQITTDTDICLSLRRMTRLLDLDEENNVAVMEAGMTGREVEEALAERGFTLGHEPDSWEHSTVGGWISTRASGMRRGRYGNAEDFVIGVRLLGYDGETLLDFPSGPVRTSSGPDPLGVVLGHEGTLGVVSAAMLQVRRLPEAREYGAYLFPSFEAGSKFCRDAVERDCLPSSLRLVDEPQLALAEGLSQDSGLWARCKRTAKRWFLRYVLRFKEPAAGVAVFEGTRAFVRYQRRELARIARSHGGMVAGGDSVRRNHELTHRVAYLRDFINRLGVIGETFETSAPWSHVLSVRRAVLDEFGEMEGGFISCRLSQAYVTGACLYFTVAVAVRDGESAAEGADRATALLKRLRVRMREAGGSVSHHHGIGSERADEPRKYSSGELRGVLEACLATRWC